jgi:hypothetical protein
MIAIFIVLSCQVGMSAMDAERKALDPPMNADERRKAHRAAQSFCAYRTMCVYLRIQSLLVA